jgi:hypothetical protein
MIKWGFAEMEDTPIAGWCGKSENNMYDLGVPPFQETSK